MKGKSVIRRRVLVGIAVLAIVGAACGGNGDEGASEESNDAGDGASSVTLTAAEFKFDPSSLSAAAGGSIEFTNNDDAEHNFTAEDAGIDEDVDAGGSTTIDLADVEPGSYDFFCEYHPDMTGTLEVTE